MPDKTKCLIEWVYLQIPKNLLLQIFNGTRPHLVHSRAGQLRGVTFREMV